MPRGTGRLGPAPNGKTPPKPAQPLCSALQVIEKMERVLEDQLRDRKEPLLNRLPGKPTMGESAPQLVPAQGAWPSRKIGFRNRTGAKDAVPLLKQAVWGSQSSPGLPSPAKKPLGTCGDSV